VIKKFRRLRRRLSVLEEEHIGRLEWDIVKDKRINRDMES